MFIDALLKVDAAHQVTADAVSQSSVDLGDVTPKRQIGTGEPIGIAVAIKAIGTNSGSALFQAISSAAADLGSGTTVMGQVALVTADIAAGRLFFIPIPPGQPILRYIGVNYDITGTVDFTVDAWVTSASLFSLQAKAYAKNYGV